MTTLRQRLAITTILLLIAVTAAGCALLQETEEASEPISAIPIATAETEAVDETDTSETDTGEVEDSGADPTLFQFAQAESEARFLIGEILRGQPQTVVGVTDQVAAEIVVDLNNPADAQLGTVQVNARALATDESRRNRAIGNWILETGDFEFINFNPTEIFGLPEELVFGENVSLEITGDLTIRDITDEVTFQATVTPVSESRLEGLASTTINRGDFELTIPSVPFVADVDEEILLEIEFVATPG